MDAAGYKGQVSLVQNFCMYKNLEVPTSEVPILESKLLRIRTLIRCGPKIRLIVRDRM